MRVISTMIVLTLSSMWGGSVEAGPTYSTTEVAYVSEVSGRVVALMQGRPTLLDTLDVFTDQTRIDLLANSERNIAGRSSTASCEDPLRAALPVPCGVL